MKRSSLTEFEIEEEGLKLRICRSVENKGNGAQTASPYPVAVPAYAPAPPLTRPPRRKKGSS